MKRTWKNFRLDKNKVYQFIGQTVVYTSGWALGVAFFYWAFLQRINLLGGKDGSYNNFYYYINIGNNILA